MIRWLQKLVQGVETADISNEPITLEQRKWIFQNFPTATPPQLLEPETDSHDPVVSILAYIGSHRIYFFNRDGKLCADVVINYCNPGVAPYTEGFDLYTSALRHKFLQYAHMLRGYQVPLLSSSRAMLDEWF